MEGPPGGIPEPGQAAGGQEPLWEERPEAQQRPPVAGVLARLGPPEDVLGGVKNLGY